MEDCYFSSFCQHQIKFAALTEHMQENSSKISPPADAENPHTENPIYSKVSGSL